MPSAKLAVSVLQDVLDAFNAHDVDADHVLLRRGLRAWTCRAGPGREVGGWWARSEVREGIRSRLDGIPDVHYGDDSPLALLVTAGVSEWTIRGTQPSGERIEVRGCDLFEFVDGKISRKDSFWKIVD